MSGKTSEYSSEIGKRYTIGHMTVTIDSVIAEGGYGVVFLARNALGQRFALKRIYVNDETRLKECQKEIQIMGCLSSHKNIITFVDSSITRSYKGVWEVLILMVYCPDSCVHTLERRGRRGFSESEVLRIFCDVCEAVSRLHHCKTPIIHRDLKIENILVDAEGNFVLCDFGSATAHFYQPGLADRTLTDIEEELKKTTTPSHRAPEMIDVYARKSITTKADIWALGVTLYRLCFRTLPFGDSSIAIQAGSFTIPEHSSFSQGLLALMLFCLQVDPDTRPDIYQVSSVAFKLANRPCPVLNICNSYEPNIKVLIEALDARVPSEPLSRAKSPVPKVDWVETTTVNPRERPKAGKAQAPVGLPKPTHSLNTTPTSAVQGHAGPYQTSIISQHQQHHASVAHPNIANQHGPHTNLSLPSASEKYAESSCLAPQQPTSFVLDLVDLDLPSTTPDTAMGQLSSAYSGFEDDFSQVNLLAHDEFGAKPFLAVDMMTDHISRPVHANLPNIQSRGSDGTPASPKQNAHGRLLPPARGHRRNGSDASPLFPIQPPQLSHVETMTSSWSGDSFVNSPNSGELDFVREFNSLSFRANASNGHHQFATEPRASATAQVDIFGAIPFNPTTA